MDEKEILYQAGIFQGISPKAAFELANKLIPVDFKKDQIIFREGEMSDGLYIVLSGKVIIARSSGDKKENFLTLMGPADMFGELAVFDPGPRISTATALTDLKTVMMTRGVLKSWMRNNPEVSELLLRVLARRLRRTNNSIADLIFTDVPGRVAKELVLLAQRFGETCEQGIRVNHELTQQELAQLVGASRETVNKTLSDFASRNWLKQESKGVIITSIEELIKRSRSRLLASAFK